MRTSARSLAGSVATTAPSRGSVSPAQPHVDRLGVVDHVGVGDDLAVGGDDHAGAGRLADDSPSSITRWMATTLDTDLSATAATSMGGTAPRRRCVDAERGRLAAVRDPSRRRGPPTIAPTSRRPGRARRHQPPISTSGCERRASVRPRSPRRDRCRHQVLGSDRGGLTVAGSGGRAPITTCLSAAIVVTQAATAPETRRGAGRGPPLS